MRDRSTKKVTKITETADFGTGEIKTSTKEMILEKEPEFVKLYLADILMLKELPKGASPLLYALLRKMDYEGLISLNAGNKRKMAQELGISTGSIGNSITDLVRAEVLLRVDVGCYVANPYLFGKGGWAEISQCREKWVTLQVTYKAGPKGKPVRDVQTVIKDRQAQLPLSLVGEDKAA